MYSLLKTLREVIKSINIDSVKLLMWLSQLDLKHKLTNHLVSTQYRIRSMFGIRTAVNLHGIELHKPPFPPRSDASFEEKKIIFTKPSQQFKG